MICLCDCTEDRKKKRTDKKKEIKSQPCSYVSYVFFKFNYCTFEYAYMILSDVICKL